MQGSAESIVNDWTKEAETSSSDIVSQWESEAVESEEMEPQGFGKAMSVLGAGSEGFLRGLAIAAGAPVDLTNLALQQVGLGSERPVLGSKMIQESLMNLGESMKETLQPEAVSPSFDVNFPIGQGGSERFMRRVGEDVGVGFGWLVPFLGAAGRGVQGGTLTRGIIEPLAKAPGRATAAELAVGAGSGTGAAIAQEVAPGNELAEMGAQLAGGLAVAGPLAAAGAATKRITDRVAPFSKEATRRDVAEILQNQAVDVEQAVKNIRRTASGDVPEGFSPTAGQASQDPGLMNVEVAVSELAPQTIRRRRFEQNQAISGVLERTEPSGVAEDVTDFLSGRISTINRTLDRKIADADEAARAALSRLGNPDAQAANTAARKELEKALKSARETESSLWKEIGGAEVDMTAVKSTARKMINERMKSERGQDFPDVARFVSKAPKEGGKNKRVLKDKENIDEVLALRHRILDEIREESAGVAPNRNKIRRLNELHDSVMKTIDSTGVGADFDAARAYSRALNDKFTRGVVGRVLRLDRAGGAVVPEEQTLPRLTASQNALNDLTRAVGGNEVIEDAVTDYMVNKFISDTVNVDGSVSVKAARKWLQDNDFALLQYPKARNSIKAAVLSAGRGERIRNVAAREAARVQKSQASKWTNTDIDRAIQVAMSGTNRIQKINSLMRSARRDPTGAAERGVKRAAWDRFMSQFAGESTDMAGTPFLRPNAMKKILEQTDMLKALGYSDGEIKNLRSAYNATRLLTTQAKGGFLPGTSQTAEKAFTMNMLLSRLWGVQRGAVSPRYVGSELFGRFVRARLNQMKKEDVAELLTEAIMDPSVMELLLTTPTNKKESARVAKRLNSLFANLGATATGIRNDEGP